MLTNWCYGALLCLSRMIQPLHEFISDEYHLRFVFVVVFANAVVVADAVVVALIDKDTVVAVVV